MTFVMVFQQIHMVGCLKYSFKLSNNQPLKIALSLYNFNQIKARNNYF